MKRALRILLRTVVALAALFGLLSIDWRCSPPAGFPKVISQGHEFGALRAGVAEAALLPPYPAPIAGYNTHGNKPFSGVYGPPPEVRAIVIEVGGKRVAIISAELLLIPSALRRKIANSLGVDDLIIGATHTHSGVGGYWDNRVAELLGVGKYDPKVEAFITEQIEAAAKGAIEKLSTAKLFAQQFEGPAFAANRDIDGPVDHNESLVRINYLSGFPMATLVSLALHPTIFPRNDDELSGDWPAEMMAQISDMASHTPTLFLQGAMGDTTSNLLEGNGDKKDRSIKLGEMVAADFRKRWVGQNGGDSQVLLDWARVAVVLPGCDLRGVVPPILNRAASNLFCWATHPGTTEVSVLRVGRFEIATVPAEVVGSLGMEWRKDLDGAAIISVADDYVGYVEEPERVNARKGEARHSYFGPALAPALWDGLKLARETAIKNP